MDDCIGIYKDIIMNKSVISSFLAGSIMAALSLPAFAAGDSGTVNFAGRVVANTCEIDVDGSGTTSSTVTFADTYPSDFGSDGAVGTTKAFKIEVKKCDPLVSKINLKFSGTTTDAAKKRLKNDLSGAGNASNVGIIVSNENGSKGDVVFDGSEPAAGTDVANDATGASASVFNYIAKVIQIGNTAPNAGRYSSSATFEVMYR